jgi:hypothetical protein
VTEQEELTHERQPREAYLAEAQRLSRTGSFGWNVSNDEHFWSDRDFPYFRILPFFEGVGANDFGLRSSARYAFGEHGNRRCI